MNKPCILIADDDHDLVDALTERCRRMGLSVVTAHRGLAAFNAVLEHQPDVICLDVNMPAGNGMSICEMLADDPKIKSTPVIVLTGSGEPQVIRRCHDMCAFYVQKCPDVWQRIEPLLCELLKLDPDPQTPVNDHVSPSADPTRFQAAGDAAETSDDTELLDAVFAMLNSDPASAESSATSDGAPEDTRRWILHIEDDQDLSVALSMRLRPYGISVIRAFAGMEGYRRAFLNPADAIILDFELPDGNGDYVMRRLKENPVTKDIPVIILTGRKERTVERQMTNLGADAYLTKPLNFNVLLAELERLVGLRRERSGMIEEQLVRA